MSDSLKILFLTAEAAPFAKRGGLGDVGGSLPIALRAMGHDLRVVMPAYQNVESGYPGVEALPIQLAVPMRDGPIPAGLFLGHLPGSDVPVYFIAQWHLFKRPEVYGYWDDAYRFAFFSRAAFELAEAIDWQPDLVHGHDWHSAPALTWLATAGQGNPRYRGIPSLFTIHNMAHQGRAGWDILDQLGVLTHSLYEEAYGEVNFMARGIYHATVVNTVSPSYALEIMTPAGGAGLDGLLRYRQEDLHGILNGLDYATWNPATDGRIAQAYDVDDLEARVHNRRALQDRAGLAQRDDVPLLAMITRLDRQKGLDITGHVVHLLLNGFAGDAQFVILGSGDPLYEAMFAQLAGYHTEKMRAFLTYDAELAPLIYAGSDIFLMPSLFEPCGLGQMIAMRYGSVPVVRATGGLADTVLDGVTGFTFLDYSADAFARAVRRAVTTFHTDREAWQVLQENGMKQDFSWERSALGYDRLYRDALARTGR
jgi:starch synthase